MKQNIHTPKINIDIEPENDGLEIWKIIFLFQGHVLRFHVNLPGCMKPTRFWFNVAFSKVLHPMQGVQSQTKAVGLSQCDEANPKSLGVALSRKAPGETHVF